MTKPIPVGKYILQVQQLKIMQNKFFFFVLREKTASWVVGKDSIYKQAKGILSDKSHAVAGSWKKLHIKKQENLKKLSRNTRYMLWYVTQKRRPNNKFTQMCCNRDIIVDKKWPHV